MLIILDSARKHGIADDDMIMWSYYHGPNPYRFILSKREGIDIDDALDLAVAEAWLDYQIK